MVLPFSRLIPAKLKNKLRANESLVRLYRNSQVPFAKGRLVVDASRLEIIKRYNRASLELVDDWNDDVSFRNSIINYGIDERTRSVLNEPLGMDTTYSDLLSYFTREPETSISYLEIGTSVGKNFWQIVNLPHPGLCWAIDIEDISGPLNEMLTPVSTMEVWSDFESDRKRPIRVSVHRHPASLKRVTYCAGDLFDEKVWDVLDGNKFSVVFSDAFHNPDAIRWEWKQLKERDLLDQRGFTIVWDDLEYEAMRTAFAEIAADCCRHYNLSQRNVCFTETRGWVGTQEPPHPVGIISSRGFVT